MAASIILVTSPTERHLARPVSRARSLEKAGAWIRNLKKPRETAEFRIHGAVQSLVHSFPRRTSTAWLPQALVATAGSLSARPIQPGHGQGAGACGPVTPIAATRTRTCRPWSKRTEEPRHLSRSVNHGAGARSRSDRPRDLSAQDEPVIRICQSSTAAYASCMNFSFHSASPGNS